MMRQTAFAILCLGTLLLAACTIPRSAPGTGGPPDEAGTPLATATPSPSGAASMTPEPATTELPTATPSDTFTPFVPTSTFTPFIPTSTPTPFVPTSTFTAQPSGGGSFGGTVWVDSDADGTLDPNEDGRLAGVTVYLGQGPCPSTGYKTSVTNSNGRYNFEYVPNAVYCISTNVVRTCETPSIATTPKYVQIDLGAYFDIWILNFGYAPYVC